MHKDWVVRLGEEFYLQGDRERDANMAISPLMDRTKGSSLFTSQVPPAALAYISRHTVLLCEAAIG